MERTARKPYSIDQKMASLLTEIDDDLENYPESSTEYKILLAIQTFGSRIVRPNSEVYDDFRSLKRNLSKLDPRFTNDIFAFMPILNRIEKAHYSCFRPKADADFA